MIDLDIIARTNEQINRIDSMLEKLGINDTFYWWHRPNADLGGVQPCAPVISIDAVEEYVSSLSVCSAVW